MEKIYKTMKRAGIGNIVFGIITLLVGIATGILMIISGASLMHEKKNLIF